MIVGFQVCWMESNPSKGVWEGFGQKKQPCTWHILEMSRELNMRFTDRVWRSRWVRKCCAGSVFSCMKRLSRERAQSEGTDQSPENLRCLKSPQSRLGTQGDWEGSARVLGESRSQESWKAREGDQPLSAGTESSPLSLATWRSWFILATAITESWVGAEARLEHTEEWMGGKKWRRHGLWPLSGSVPLSQDRGREWKLEVDVGSRENSFGYFIYLFMRKVIRDGRDVVGITQFLPIPYAHSGTKHTLLGLLGGLVADVLTCVPLQALSLTEDSCLDQTHSPSLGASSAVTGHCKAKKAQFPSFNEGDSEGRSLLQSSPGAADGLCCNCMAADAHFVYPAASTPHRASSQGRSILKSLSQEANLWHSTRTHPLSGILDCFRTQHTFATSRKLTRGSLYLAHPHCAPSALLCPQS